MVMVDHFSRLFFVISTYQKKRIFQYSNFFEIQFLALAQQIVEFPLP